MVEFLFSNLREAGAPIKGEGAASGVVPVMKLEGSFSYSNHWVNVKVQVVIHVFHFRYHHFLRLRKKTPMKKFVLRPFTWCCSTQTNSYNWRKNEEMYPSSLPVELEYVYRIELTSISPKNDDELRSQIQVSVRQKSRRVIWRLKSLNCNRITATLMSSTLMANRAIAAW